MICREIRDRLSALIDGELTREQAEAVREHVAACSSCRETHEGLVRTQIGLAELFRDSLETAPAAPPVESLVASSLPPERWSPLLKAAAAVAAAILVTLGIFYFTPEEVVDESPAAVVERAATRFQELDDVELWVRLESKGIQALIALFGDEDEKEKKDLARLRILAAPKRGFLVQEVEDFRVPLAQGKPVSGYDGQLVWEHNEDEGCVEIHEPSDDDGQGLRELFFGAKPKSKGTAPDPLALSYLSWDFLSRLQREQGSFDLEDVTGPSAERVGRRVFRITPRLDLDEDGTKETKFSWSRSTLTIDPARNLIEKLELEVTLAGFSLLTIHVEVAKVNQGLDERLFRWQTHLPEGTKVVHAKHEDEDD